MGRSPKYTDQQILDAALDLVAQGGAQAATAVAIAARLGAPSGSIYHRFASRDLILATLWIRTAKRFQQGFLASLDVEDTGLAAERAVTHTLDWVAAHRQEAQILSMYRREDLIALWPDELGDEFAVLNDGVKGALEDFTLRHFGAATPEALGRARFALISLPHAAVREAIALGEVPGWLADSVTAAAAAVLEAE